MAAPPSWNLTRPKTYSPKLAKSRGSDTNTRYFCVLNISGLVGISMWPAFPPLNFNDTPTHATHHESSTWRSPVHSPGVELRGWAKFPTSDQGFSLFPQEGRNFTRGVLQTLADCSCGFGRCYQGLPAQYSPICSGMNLSLSYIRGSNSFPSTWQLGQVLVHQLTYSTASPNPRDEGSHDRHRWKCPRLRWVCPAMGTKLGWLVGILSKPGIFSRAGWWLQSVHGHANDLYDWLWKSSRWRCFSGPWWEEWVVDKSHLMML